MGRWMGSDEYKYNTMGKSKCTHCGLYYEDNMTSHGCQSEKNALAEEEQE